MTEIDPPYTCPHCGKVLEFIRDHAGRTVHIRKGWRDVEERNRIILERYASLITEGRPKMTAQAIVAQEFCLSPRNVRKIIYEDA